MPARDWPVEIVRGFVIASDPDVPLLAVSVPLPESVTSWTACAPEMVTVGLEERLNAAESLLAGAPVEGDQLEVLAQSPLVPLARAQVYRTGIEEIMTSPLDPPGLPPPEILARTAIADEST